MVVISTCYLSWCFYLALFILFETFTSETFFISGLSYFQIIKILSSRFLYERTGETTTVCFQAGLTTKLPSKNSAWISGCSWGSFTFSWYTKTHIWSSWWCHTLYILAASLSMFRLAIFKLFASLFLIASLNNFMLDIISLEQSLFLLLQNAPHLIDFISDSLIRPPFCSKIYVSRYSEEHTLVM